MNLQSREVEECQRRIGKIIEEGKMILEKLKEIEKETKEDDLKWLVGCILNSSSRIHQYLKAFKGALAHGEERRFEWRILFAETQSLAIRVKDLHHRSREIANPEPYVNVMQTGIHLWASQALRALADCLHGYMHELHFLLLEMTASRLQNLHYEIEKEYEAIRMRGA